MATIVSAMFCVDYASSMLPDFNQIRAILTLVCTTILGNLGSRIGLIKFQSLFAPWRTHTHGFTQSIDTFLQWFDSTIPSDICEDGNKAVGDALYAALYVDWGAPDDNEKLVVLITDGAPNGLFKDLNGADPWEMSKKFMEKGITLVVVGVGESIVECDDFYCALAENTGGIYIPMINFQRIFLQVLPLVLNEGDTFRQAFRHILMEEIEKNSSFKYSPTRQRVKRMIKECATIGDIHKLFFTYH